jgi:hypothetical protein
LIGAAPQAQSVVGLSLPLSGTLAPKWKWPDSSIF